MSTVSAYGQKPNCTQSTKSFKALQNNFLRRGSYYVTTPGVVLIQGLNRDYYNAYGFKFQTWKTSFHSLRASVLLYTLLYACPTAII